MQTVHVVMRKEDLDPAKVAGKVAVVFDVLFATSTIVTAMERGVADVVPSAEPDEARRAAEDLQEGSFLLAGELHMEPIPGFAPSVPLRLSQEPLAGKRLIFSTTNGTVALRRAEQAAVVYAGALLNGKAVAERIVQHHHQEKVLLVCAGDGGAFNIEDFVGAGYVLDCLLMADPARWSLTDAAMAAHELYLGVAPRLERCLLQSRLGRIIHTMGQGAEVEHCARAGIFNSVPILKGQRLVPAAVDDH